MSELPIHHYTFYSGSKVSRNITWKPGGVAFDFTGSDVNVIISRKKGQEAPDLMLSVGSGVSLVDAQNGIINFTITKAQSLLLGDLYFYDIELADEGDLILTGTMHFTGDV